MKAPSKILGVYGGMGPAASAEFMRLLAEMAPATCDQEHPIVYLLSDSQTPDRTDAFFGRGADPTERLRSGLEKLCCWGADLLTVPCNTAHIFIDKFRHELKVPLVHIVEATLEDAINKAPNGSWIIATGATLASGIYTEEAKRLGYRFLEVDEEIRALATKAITLVKAGDLPSSGNVMIEIANKLWSIKELPIVTACTELPLAYQASKLPLDMTVSSLRSLSRACLEMIYKEN